MGITLKQTLEESKPTESIKIGFSINDCPLWLIKEFKNDIKTRYNNVYWTKLLDIMRKAQAYDYLMAGEFPEYENERIAELKEQLDERVEEPVQKEDKDEVITFGSRYSMKKR
jgi:hypothetical protein